MYTNKYFKFPIIMYDGISIENILESEEKQMEAHGAITDNLVPEFCVGWARVPYKEFENQDVMWLDTYKKGDTIEDVKKDKRGFQETLIVTKHWGEFVCAWTMKEFEEKLNAFMKKYEENVEKFR